MCLGCRRYLVVLQKSWYVQRDFKREENHMGGKRTLRTNLVIFFVDLLVNKWRERDVGWG